MEATRFSADATSLCIIYINFMKAVTHDLFPERSRMLTRTAESRLKPKENRTELAKCEQNQIERRISKV